ncbi:MAG TPA: DNA-formamidopyrimidine glycosylase family protein [Streptosporangiaceae bacterium]|nr:DNA-formamidopyrimidine glycosylase family protein [Streptosporangiaceae bacterium]
MPELPEVENARRLIAEHALGRRIADVDDSDTYVLRPHAPGELKSALAGRSLTAAHRRGKTMWVETSGVSDGPAASTDAAGPEVGIHLGMSGRLVVTGPDGTVIEAGDPYRYGGRGRNPAWSRFTLTFTDGGSLVLLDPRRLGRVWLNPGIGDLGPDATQVSFDEFRALITKGTIAVKARLLDQSKIAGIGNLLADEILWQARVSPLTPAGQLTAPRVRRLYEATTAVVAAAIARGGAHTGEINDQRRPGGTCPRDGAPMAHAVVGGRSTWFCSREQALRPARRRAARRAG